jgi:hypothetical protein
MGLESGRPSSLVTKGAWADIAGQKSPTTVYEPDGGAVTFSVSKTLSKADGSRQTVNDQSNSGQYTYLPTSGSALIIPSLQSEAKAKEYSSLDEDRLHTYAGSDMRAIIEPIYKDSRASNKQLIELTTLTVSIHREKSPVRAISYINPKAFARGRRTIAGTMILTQFTVDVMYRFLSGKLDERDASKDSFYLKVDQLPPFNMTLMFCDEYGHASYRRLLGVDVVTDGTVYSVNDMMTEQTVSYMAADFTPLMPLRRSVLFEPSEDVKAQKTPKDIANQIASLDPMSEMIKYNNGVTTVFEATRISSEYSVETDGRIPN